MRHINEERPSIIRSWAEWTEMDEVADEIKIHLKHADAIGRMCDEYMAYRTTLYGDSVDPGIITSYANVDQMDRREIEYEALRLMINSNAILVNKAYDKYRKLMERLLNEIQKGKEIPF
jgi:hypothetical protein